MKAHWFLALFALLLCVGLAFTACGDDDDDDSGGDDDDDGGGDDDDDAMGDTWTDPSSGLTWQGLPSDECMTWEDAIEFCENLNFDDHDDWRLPKISELRSLIRGCEATEQGGACGVTDDCTEYDCWNDPCAGCEYLKGPGSGGAYWPVGMSGEIGYYYWSSSLHADDDNVALNVSFDDGGVGGSAGNGGLARCIR